MKAITILGLCILAISCSENREVSDQKPAQEVLNSSLELSQEDTITPAYLSKDYLMGKFDPATHEDFSLIQAKHTDKEDIYMRTDAYEAFSKMSDAAKKDGIDFKIVSATRPFHHQKRIWEGKWNGQRKVSGQDLSKTMPNEEERAFKILEFSSMPGTSRHHWGTDIDINDLENDYFESGQGLKEYEWLVANAGKYGFCQVYSEKGADRPHGYNMEKWHWSYLPVAEQLTNFAATQMNNQDIGGFDGDQTTENIDILNKYILGINPACN